MTPAESRAWLQKHARIPVTVKAIDGITDLWLGILKSVRDDADKRILALDVRVQELAARVLELEAREAVTRER
jgi:hypothetical protein